MSEKYAALIFDMVKSRKLVDRYAVQTRIKDSIKFLNLLYKDNIAKDVISSSGDEFQGLFKSVAAAYSYIHSLQLYIYPIKVRCGIGYGTLKYLESNWDSTDIDGIAYYNARDAINAIPDKNSADAIFIKTEKTIDKTINTITLSGAALKNSQSRTSRLIELVMDFYFPFTSTKTDDYIFNFFANTLKTKIVENASENQKKYNIMLGIESVLDKTRTFDFYTEVVNIYELSKNIKFKENELYFDKYYPFGCSVLVAPLILTTPQNISNTIRNGRIRENRNLDGAIYDLLLNIDMIGDIE